MTRRKIGKESCDVVVIGGGLSGLVAARRLKRAKVDVQVVEARDRVGGRLYTHRPEGGPMAELGGQWIGPGQDRILELVEEFKIQRVRQYNQGKHSLSIGGDLRTFRGEIPALGPMGLAAMQWAIFRLDWLGRSIDLDAPFTSKNAELWDSMTVETWKRRNVPSEEARICVDMAVRAIFAAEPTEISMLHFLFYLKSGKSLMTLASVDGGAQQERLVGGTQGLCEEVAKEIADQLRLETPVKAVICSDDGVEVVCEGLRINARRAIVAMAPAMWRNIDWQPGLDGRRMQLSQRMPMGAVIKVFAFYDRPFWREKGFSGEFLTDGAGLQMGFDYVGVEREFPGLVGFMTGRYARAWSSRSEEDRKVAALSTFARFFGDEALRPRFFYEKDWVADRWSQGCYAGLMVPGAWTDAGQIMRKPEGPLHWAGTETAVRGNGYMDGAVEAGRRAAAEVAEFMKSPSRFSTAPA